VVVHDAAGAVVMEEWKPTAPERPAAVVSAAPGASDGDGDGPVVDVPGTGRVRLARARFSGLTSRAVVTVGSVRSDFPNDRDAILLRAAVNQAGIALNTARSEEVVRRSEERFRQYFELGLIGMAITSPAHGILEVNDKLCEIWVTSAASCCGGHGANSRIPMICPLMRPTSGECWPAS
jgi:PAS domain-containing protein